MAALLVALVVVAAMSAGGASAGGCPESLSVCLPSLVSGSTPTVKCCTNLRARQGRCLCQYATDPKYSKYMNGPNALNTLTSCGMGMDIPIVC
ncbi:hypothetical protein EJB05_23858, partial [Eragrostis curvula]